MSPETSSNETTVNVSPAPAQGQTPETNQPSYVTVDQLNQTVAQLSQKIDQVYRGTQSRQDQFTAKVQKQVERLENAAKAQGIQLTEAQRKVMQDNVVIQTLNQEAPSTQSSGFVPGQVGPQGEVDSQLVASVNVAAETMQQVWETVIEETDPEYALMQAAEQGTPKEYLDATYKAIQQKLARSKGTSPMAQPQAAPGIPKSPGVVKGTPQSNPIQNVNDLDELFKMSKFNSRG